jgi:cation:H+ antiporter
MTVVFFVLGLLALILGAEMLVRGASRLALSFGVSPLVVGLTVVAFGTSSPELAVSIRSAVAGQADIAVGNVVGSNILNVLLILGASAMIAPLLVNRQLIRQEVPFMIGASLLLWAIAADGRVSPAEAALLLGLLGGYTVFLIVQSRREQAAIQTPTDQTSLAGVHHQGWDRHWAVQGLLVVAGLGLLVLGAHWLVEAAIAFARYLGVSELIIGLTVVAAGTSLPEIATSILAAARGERDIAVGNVVGSNTFNILGVLGTAGAASAGGLTVAPALLNFDLPVMVAAALVCLPVFFTGREIARWEGLLFLAYYLAYTLYLILHAQGHDALEPFSAVMAGVVLPLSAVTLIVLAVRHWRAGARP